MIFKGVKGKGKKEGINRALKGGVHCFLLYHFRPELASCRGFETDSEYTGWERLSKKRNSAPKWRNRGGGGEEAPVTSHECLGGTIKTSLIVDL